MIKKFRPATTPQHLQQIQNSTETRHSKECFNGTERPKLKVHPKTSRNDAFSAVLWLLGSRRHWGNIPLVPMWDIKWSEKRNQVVWRGKLTGTGGTGEKNCNDIPRCRLVKKYEESFLVDAALSNPYGMENIVGDKPKMGGRMSISQLLKYKAIIMVEGNDVSSGLKWALWCRSVVFMQEPTKTSWAMEELLEPWVHYIPLDENLGNVETQMAWVIENDEMAQRVAERATLFIYDMLYHPDAARDDAAIKKEMMERYRMFFKHEEQ